MVTIRKDDPIPQNKVFVYRFRFFNIADTVMMNLCNNANVNGEIRTVSVGNFLMYELWVERK